MYTIAGLAGLYYGTERFIDGAIATGKHLRLSNMVLGLVLLSFATSFPEMVTSAKAALDGHPAIGVGNAVGSNITNILLVVGTLLLLSEAAVHGNKHAPAFTILAIISLVAPLTVLDLHTSRIEGIMLLVGMLAFLFVLYRFPDKFVSDTEHVSHVDMSGTKTVLTLTGGLLLIFISIEVLLTGAINLAMLLGISDLVIGLTIIAVGTSLPELATVVSCARRGRVDMAIGTVLGSNIFNLLGVMGLCLAVRAAVMPQLLLWRDLPVMLAATTMLGVFILIPGNRNNRLWGAISLVCFAAYLLILYFYDR